MLLNPGNRRHMADLRHPDRVEAMPGAREALDRPHAEGVAAVQLLMRS